jgi:thioredoxin 1
MRAGHRRTWVIIPFLLGALLLGHLLPAGGQGPAPPKSRPAIYEFARKLCPICREMEQVLLEVQGKYGEQFQVRVLYIDEDIKLFRQYQITIVPTQVFLDASGKEVFRHEGLFPREKLVVKLRELGFIRD